MSLTLHTILPATPVHCSSRPASPMMYRRNPVITRGIASICAHTFPPFLHFLLWLLSVVFVSFFCLFFLNLIDCNNSVLNLVLLVMKATNFFNIEFIGVKENFKSNFCIFQKSFFSNSQVLKLNLKINENFGCCYLIRLFIGHVFNR